MNNKRGSWYLLTGLVLGAAMGLVYAWVIKPVHYINTTPASLQANYKDQYRSMIASAYAANKDLVRAKARLGLLEEINLSKTLAEQAQRTLADGQSPQVARALGLLAADIADSTANQSTSTLTSTLSAQVPTLSPTLTVATIASLTPTNTPRAISLTETAANTITPTVNVTSTQTAINATVTITTQTSLTPEPTQTPAPTGTSTPTQMAPFVLDSRASVCDKDLGEPLIQVETYNSDGEPVPGMEIIVRWDQGEDHFFTGLKPEISLGYADFTMTPEITYTLQLVMGSQPITDLLAPECKTLLNDTFWGSWELIFVQP